MADKFFSVPLVHIGRRCFASTAALRKWLEERPAYTPGKPWLKKGSTA